MQETGNIGNYAWAQRATDVAMVTVSDGDSVIFLLNLITEASDNISNNFCFSLWILTQRERLSKQYMETDCIFQNLKF